MRSVFTGVLSVATLVLPVKLGTVVSDDSLELHRYRKSDASRIRMKRVAEADGEAVEWDDTQPGYELGDRTVVLLDDDDLARAFGEKSKNVTVVTFLDAGRLPRTASSASYYVQPVKGSEKGYALLAETMKRTGKSAAVTVKLRDRDSYALLYTDGHGYLILERLHWASEVKRPDFDAPSADLTATDLDLAENLVTQMSGPFAWETLKDESAARLDAVIQAKAETGQAVGTPAPKAAAGAPTADLTAALLASVEQAKADSTPKTPVRTRAPRAKKAAA